MSHKTLVAALSGLSLMLVSGLATAQSDSQPTTSPATEAATSAPTESQEEAPALTGQELKDSISDRFSYIVGFQIGEQLKSLGLVLNHKSFASGMQSSVDGEELKYKEEDMMKLQQELQGLSEEKAAAEGIENLAKADAFLAENKTKEGVITTASGLQYMVLTPGEGESPKPDSNVTVNYKGTLLDGSDFDSSYDRGEPATFNAGQVIPGWTEGLQLMKPGAKFKFFIPPALGYGEAGSQPVIPSNSLLIFEVELIEIQ